MLLAALTLNSSMLKPPLTHDGRRAFAATLSHVKTNQSPGIPTCKILLEKTLTKEQFIYDKL